MLRIAWRMSLSLAMTVALLGMFTTVAGAASCRVAESHTTLASSSEARIFSIDFGLAPGGKDLIRYYGCLKSVGKKRLLATDIGDADSPYSFDLPKLAGRYAAFSETSGHEEANATHVRVFKLGSGHETIKDAIWPTGWPGCACDWKTDALVLTGRGFVAWSATFEYAPDNKVVMAHDSTGARQLDSGAGIDANSLTRSGNSVSWTDGGAPRSEVLS